MNELIFSTGNEAKFIAASEICRQYGINLIQQKVEIDEIQGEEPDKIMLDKTEKAFDVIKKPVIVSDDNWSIPGLNGFPGPYMKSMNEWLKPNDFINLTKGLDDKTIYLISYLGFRDADTIKTFKSTQPGVLISNPKGDYGPASWKITCMDGDRGLTISETFDQKINQANRQANQVWHDFAKWYIENN